jgi:MoaA/NifB/PqqE/SkfB family radical SAM enzyme
MDESSLAFMQTRELETLMTDVSDEEIRKKFRHDPWLRNYLVSVWERVHEKIVLTAYPWHQCYMVTDYCNAKCAFCEPYLNKSAFMGEDALAWIRKLTPYARTLILTGGEPSIHPQFRSLLQDLRRDIDPRCFFSIISNGAKLHLFLEELSQLNVNMAISLNAATPETHQKVMRLGPNALERVLETIRQLKQMGKFVSTSFVVTHENVHEVPEFLSLCEELNVDEVNVRTLNPIPFTDYQTLQPSTHPEFEKHYKRALEAIQSTTANVKTEPEQWRYMLEADKKVDVTPELAKKLFNGEATATQTKGEALSAEEDAYQRNAFNNFDMGNPYNRSHPFNCDHIYYALEILNQNLDIWPCCFMNRVPGYEPIGLNASTNFFELWNSPALLKLRESLLKGPLYSICQNCTYPLGY